MTDIERTPPAEVHGRKIYFAVPLPSQRLSPAVGQWAAIMSGGRSADQPYVVDIVNLHSDGSFDTVDGAYDLTPVRALEVCAARARRYGAK